MGILDRLSKQKDSDASPAKTEGKKAAPKRVAKAAEPKGAAPKKQEEAVKKAVPADLAHVLVKPLITEKAAHQSSRGQYAFQVARAATRIQVRNAVKAQYGIVPAAVNIQVVRGKFVRFGRTTGQRQTWKKAIVILPPGKTIDVHAGV